MSEGEKPEIKFPESIFGKRERDLKVDAPKSPSLTTDEAHKITTQELHKADMAAQGITSETQVAGSEGYLDKSRKPITPPKGKRF